MIKMLKSWAFIFRQNSFIHSYFNLFLHSRHIQSLIRSFSLNLFIFHAFRLNLCLLLQYIPSGLNNFYSTADFEESSSRYQWNWCWNKEEAFFLESILMLKSVRLSLVLVKNECKCLILILRNFIHWCSVDTFTRFFEFFTWKEFASGTFILSLILYFLMFFQRNSRLKCQKWRGDGTESIHQSSTWPQELLKSEGQWHEIQLNKQDIQK